MKKFPETAHSPVSEKTSPILLRAHALMKVYARATSAHICINDHNYIPISEMTEEMLGEKNACLFCIRYRSNIEAKNLQDLSANPCKEMHINAIKESYRFGGSYTYICPLGFMFWTSPIYLNEQFAGAVMGSGFLGTDDGETRSKMYDMCGGAVGEAELKRILDRFPRGDAKKIKAMTELMLLCAQSLSIGSEGCHAAMKRRLEQQTKLSIKIEELKNQYPPDVKQPEYPLYKEQELFEALLWGNIELGKEILNEILTILFFTNPDQFKNIQYRAIELAVLLLRMETRVDFSAKSVLEINNRYIKTIQEATTIEDLTDAMYRIVDDLAGQISSFQGIHHASALRKAELYIVENFTRKISLEEIAGAAGFSAPYFSTIFKEEMGENLSSYLNRLRVGKASYLLTETNLSLSKIARACGFEDQSWFSKIFKQYNSISPGKYRNQEGKKLSKIPVTEFSDDYRHMFEK